LLRDHQQLYNGDTVIIWSIIVTRYLTRYLQVLSKNIDKLFHRYFCQYSARLMLHSVSCLIQMRSNNIKTFSAKTHTHKNTKNTWHVQWKMMLCWTMYWSSLSTVKLNTGTFNIVLPFFSLSYILKKPVLGVIFHVLV